MASIRAQVYNSLSIMLEAGVEVRKCLRTSISPARGKLRRVWEEVAEGVRQGDSLAEGMRRHPKEFAKLDVLMVEAGEASGTLSETLKRLGQWHGFRERMKKVVISGMPLPMLVLTTAALVIPFPAWFAGSISGWGYCLEVCKPLAVFFVPIGVGWAIVMYTPKTGAARKLVDRITLRIPLVGRAVKQLALSRYFRVFHTLFQAGVPVVRCAEMSADSTGNAVVRNWVRPAAEGAREGQALSEGFGREMPREYLEAWEVGEESGKLAQVTERLATMAADKAEWMIEEISKWLPRTVYAGISVWVIYNIFKIAVGAAQQIGLNT